MLAANYSADTFVDVVRWWITCLVACCRQWPGVIDEDTTVGIVDSLLEWLQELVADMSLLNCWYDPDEAEDYDDVLTVPESGDAWAHAAQRIEDAYLRVFKEGFQGLFD